MSKVIIEKGIAPKILALRIYEALSDEELEIFMKELNALIARKKLELNQ